MNNPNKKGVEDLNKVTNIVNTTFSPVLCWNFKTFDENQRSFFFFRIIIL